MSRPEFDDVREAAVYAACEITGRFNAQSRYEFAEVIGAVEPVLFAPILALHQPCHEPGTDPAACGWAGNFHGVGSIDPEPRCTVCVDDDVYAVPYPCPTALAAGATTTTREETP